jgi:hypothetical protein
MWFVVAVGTFPIPPHVILPVHGMSVLVSEIGVIVLFKLIQAQDIVLDRGSVEHSLSKITSGRRRTPELWNQLG